MVFFTVLFHFSLNSHKLANLIRKNLLRFCHSPLNLHNLPVH